MILSKWTNAVIAISTLGLAFLAFATFIVPAHRQHETAAVKAPLASGGAERLLGQAPVDDSGFPASIRMSEVDAGGTGFIQAPGAPAENRVYYRLIGWEEATPVIAGDTVYCTGRPVVAYELASGREKWRFDPPSLPHPWAAVSDTAVYIACGETMYAIGRTNGRILWRARLKGELTCRPILVGDWVVVGTENGVAGIVQHNGRSRFTFPGETVQCLAASGDTLYVGGKNLYAYDLRKLAVLWKRELSEPLSRLMAQGGNVYCCDRDERLVKLSCESGRQLWVARLQAGVRGLVLAGERIFSATAEGPLIAFDTETGKEVWRMALPVIGPLDAFSIAGDRIYATTNSESQCQSPNTLFVVDIPRKKTVWKMAGCSGKPLVYGDMVFTNVSGYRGDDLIAIGPGSLSSCTEVTSLQVCCESVRQLYEQGDSYWKEAELLAMKGLKQWPQGTVFHLFESNIYKGAPYLLNVLANIYRSRGNSAAALQCYRRMYREYRTEKFRTGNSETQGVLFVSGAEGLSGQARILRENLHDYEGAIRTAYLLMDEFGAERIWGWEYSISYWWLAQDHIHQSLEKMNAPIERWEIEYRRLQSKAPERPDVADLWIKLARHFAETHHFERSIALYSDVRKEFADYYRLSDYGNEVSCPALDACRELAALYKMLRYPAGQQAGLADEIRSHEVKVEGLLKRGLAGEPGDGG